MSPKTWPLSLLLASAMGTPLFARAEPSSPLAFDLVPQTAHTRGVVSVAVSPDGRVGASAGWDRSVRLWDLSTARLLRVLRGEANFWAVAFRPNGRHVLSGDERGHVALWEVETGKRVFRVKAHAGVVRAVAISPDGALAISGGDDRSLSLWDLEKGVATRKIEDAHPRPLTALAVAPNGRIFLSLSGDPAESGRLREDNIRVWRLPTGRLVRSLSWPLALPQTAAFLPAPRYVVIGASSEKSPVTLALWDLVTGEPRKGLRLRRGDQSIYSVAIAPDGRTVVASTLTNLLRWDLDTGRYAHGFVARPFGAKSLALLRDGKTAFAGGLPRVGDDSGDLLRLIDLDSGRDARRFRAEADPVYALAFSPDGRRLAAGMSTGEVAVWDVPMAKLERTILAHRASTHAVAFSPDGATLASGGFDDAVRLFDAASGAHRASLYGHPSALRSLAFFPDGKSLLSGSWDHIMKRRGGTLRRWSLETKKPEPFETQKLPGGNWIQAVAIAPSGRTFLAATFGGALAHWDVETGKPIRVLARGVRKGFTSVAFSPDGARAAATTLAGAVLLFDVATGKESGRIEAEETGGMAFSVAFAPDGQTFAVGTGFGIAPIYDAATRQRVRTLGGHGDRIFAVAFSPTTDLVATGGNDGLVRLHRLRSGASLSMSAGRGDWVVFDGRGRFDASAGGGRLAAMVQGTEVFAIDQFAIRNNRPDLLLEAMDLGTPEAIAHFRALHEKRLRRAGLGEASASRELRVPRGRIVSAKVEGRFAELVAELRDERSPLLRYNVFVNDVPVFGSLGKTTSGRESLVREKIELTPGTNKLEVSAINAEGAESYRALTVVESSVAKTGDLYFLGFGVSKYKDPTLALAYADRDASELARYFRAVRRGYGQTFVKTYLNEEVTVAAVKEAKAFLARARPADTFVLFVSGHGLHGPTPEAPFYFLTHEADRRNLDGTAAPFALFEELLASVAPRRKLFLLDACESGERDPTEEARAVLAAGPDARARGLRIVARAVKAPTPRPFLFQRDRFVYNDLLRRTGAVVFSSSRGGELSYESDTRRHGYFTFALLQALSTPAADLDRDGVLTTEELRRYVAEAVRKRSRDAQNPTIDRDNLEARITLPVLRRVPRK